MAILVSPFGPKPQFVDSTGAPCLSYRLFVYLAGSNTKVNSFTNSTGLSANLNPIVFNALGEPPNEIWLASGLLYKFVFCPPGTDDPPTSPVWTLDNLSAMNDVTSATLSEWVAFGNAPTFISSTSFSLAGNQTSIFQIGRRVLTTNTGGTIYSTISNSSFAAGITTVTVVNDSGVLDSGLSSVSYGLLGATNPSIPATLNYINSINGSQIAGVRNRIVNGGFGINQRVVSGAVVLGAGAVGHDRWIAGAAGCSYTFNIAQEGATLTISAGSLKQTVKGDMIATTGTYCLSWAGTCQGKIDAGAFSASGVTGTGTLGTDMSVEFGTGTLQYVQLEFGTTKTLFEHLEPAHVLLQCQRDYCKSFALATAPGNAVTVAGALTYAAQIAGISNNGVSWRYPAEMRSTPTVTLYNPGAGGGGLWRNQSVGAASGVPTTNSIGPSGVFIVNPQIVGDAAGNIISIHATAATGL